MIFAFTPFVVAWWAHQARRGAEPSTVAKMALGCAGVAAANALMAVAAMDAGAGAKGRSEQVRSRLGDGGGFWSGTRMALANGPVCPDLPAL